MSNLEDILEDIHFNQFASLLSMAMSHQWRMQHPEYPNMVVSLEEFSRMFRGMGHTRFPPNKQRDILVRWNQLMVSLVNADPRLSYGEEDLNWFVEILDGDDAVTVLMLLIAVSSSQQSWYTSEQVATATGQSASAWKDKAADGRFVGAAKAGKTWIFPGLALRAQGIKMPKNGKEDTEIEERI